MSVNKKFSNPWYELEGLYSSVFIREISTEVKIVFPFNSDRDDKNLQEHIFLYHKKIMCTKKTLRSIKNYTEDKLAFLKK